MQFLKPTAHRCYPDSYYLVVLFGLYMVLAVTGCAMTPAAPAVALPAIPTAVVPAPPPAPMTLPRFLGLDVLGRATVSGARRVRIRLASRWPVLQPTARNAPLPVGDPANLASPSPAVASAAAVQQAAADAPAKVQALAYLGTVDCSQYPQVEEALLAGLDDCSHTVRAAAVQAIIDSQSSCTSSGCGCNGCCSPAIRSKLSCMAYNKTDTGCYCEPEPSVRRLSRIALDACGGCYSPAEVDAPVEVTPPEIIELIQATPQG